METSYILTMVVVRVYTFVKTLETVHYKCVHFIIYQLYLSQVSLKAYELSCTQLLISCNLPVLSCLSYVLLGPVFTLVTFKPTLQIYEAQWSLKYFIACGA